MSQAGVRSDHEKIVRPSTFSHQTEALLKEMILRGSLAPGERVNEVALATELGISRGPLREALQRLAGEGLVTMVSHRGTFIRRFTREEVVELYELRTALEAHAVRLACRRASAADLNDLEELLRQTKGRIAAAESHAYPSDLDFHSLLVGLAENSAITRAWIETQQQITLARVRSAQQPVRALAALGEHERLLQAAQARDEASAVCLIVKHLHHSMEGALRALNLPVGESSIEEK